MQIRKATPEDIDTLIRFRLNFLEEDWGGLAPQMRDAIARQMAQYLGAHISDGTFLAALAEADGRVVSTAFLAISERPANPHFPNGRVGTLLNVFTCPEYRRQGFAARVISLLMQEAAILEVSCIELLATQAGKPVYEKLGFEISAMTPMRFTLG